MDTSVVGAGRYAFIGSTGADGSMYIGRTQLNNGTTAPTYAISVDTSGNVSISQRITAASQPGFRAIHTSNITSGTANSTLVFTTEEYDRGGVYNNGTGVFTVPVTGLYLVFASAVIYNSAGFIVDGNGVNLWNGSAMVAYAPVSGISNNNASTSVISTVISLSASSTLVLRTNSGLSASTYVQGSANGGAFWGAQLLC
jgi:hypothetical protein